MPSFEAPCVELGSAPRTPSFTVSPSPSEMSTASSPEPPRNIRPTPLFRALTVRPPDPEQPPDQDELERRLPGYRRIVIPRELTLIELLKECSGVTTDEEVLGIREAKLRVIADRIGLRRLHVLAPRLRKLVLDGSAIASLRDLGIGLVHLKILSVNRCNLMSLDGVWGLGSLRELYAAGNRIQDPQPLAALQKLHTVDLSNNPLAEFSRLWTLGVCGALRRLTLHATPASDMPDYRSTVATALPMLVYLDERPMHMDIDYDSDGEIENAGSSSDTDIEEELELQPKVTKPIYDDPIPGPSHLDVATCYQAKESGCCSLELPVIQRKSLLRRPATTENAGIRPVRPDLPSRPRTAQDKRVTGEPVSKLHILYTLIDDDWLGSGSKLTSVDPMCGNLARALRRTSSTKSSKDTENELLHQTMLEATQSIAAEIPRAPKLEDWIKFRENTGIDIDIDLNERPQCTDSSKILDRLEQIERETLERFKEASRENPSVEPSYRHSIPNSIFTSIPSRSDFELYSQSSSSHSVNLDSDINTFFEDVSEFHAVDRERFRFLGNGNEQNE